MFNLLKTAFQSFIKEIKRLSSNDTIVFNYCTKVNKKVYIRNFRKIVFTEQNNITSMVEFHSLEKKSL